jgi:hypothetical protein
VKTETSLIIIAPMGPVQPPPLPPAHSSKTILAQPVFPPDVKLSILLVRAANTVEQIEERHGTELQKVKTGYDRVVDKVKAKVAELKESVGVLKAEIKDLKLSLRNSQVDADRFRSRLESIKKGTMCPVCYRGMLVSRNESFTYGNQVIAHIRGMQDSAHVAYREGSENGSLAGGVWS